MQNRYVGDIGDYAKLAILRALAGDHRIGMLWWLFPDEDRNKDGRHIGYLNDPARWRSIDPTLFDRLAAIVADGSRSVAAIQRAHLLGNAVFVDDPVPIQGPPPHRIAERRRWLDQARERISACDLVFVDPDNGFETAGFDKAGRAAGKSVAITELAALKRPDRTIIVYHHQTRRPGGHLAEIDHWRERLRSAGFQTIDVLRSASYSARAFFILDPALAMRTAAAELARRWPDQQLTLIFDPIDA